MPSEETSNTEDVSAASAAMTAVSIEEEDPLATNYGDIPFNNLQSKEISGRKWTEVKQLNSELKDRLVLVRGRAHSIRAVGKKIAIVVVRERGFAVPCVLTAAPDLVSLQMVKFATNLSLESIVDVEGVVSVPSQAITGATQQVEIQVRKLYCVNRAILALPLTVEDAARSDVQIEKALQAGEQVVRVDQDTRLKYRVIDIRTPANQAIFRIKSRVKNIFSQFLLAESFGWIATPKLNAGSTEGGAAVFDRVFEIGHLFRAEDYFTHKHLCEFTGLDVEMEIKEHYSEVMDIVDRLFVKIFDSLYETCSKELEAINKQYPFHKLKYLRQTLRLTFEEGVEMLKEAGVEIDPLGALNTETKKKLGQLVLDKYGTEFYILHRYPLAVRPFYTMPCHDNPNYSNSFDAFIRGEEIISGAQHVYVPELLTEQAQARLINVRTISTYMDAFRYGAPPHGGFVAILEHVVMLFCALDNIGKTILFST